MTNIEWVKNPDGTQGITLNPLTGCKNHTPEGLCLDGLFPCYAWKLAHTRLKQRYLANTNIVMRPIGQNGKLGYRCDQSDFKDPFYPRFWEERLTPLHIPRKAGSPKKGIFVCDMGDLFGDSIPRSWQDQVFNAIKANPDYRFYLLTKQPQRLPEFSPFPDNAWVGVTATNDRMLANAIRSLQSIEATVKFISLEPLLSWNTPFDYLVWESLWRAHIDWLIIGGCTGSSWEMVNLGEKHNRDLTEPSAMNRLGTKWVLQPRIEWVREIVSAADKAGVKVFLKNNLKPLLVKEKDGNEYAPLWANGGFGTLRQEMPETAGKRQEVPK